MTRHDNDDLDFITGDGAGPGGRVTAVVQMLVGALIFITALLGMFYETEMALSSHSLRTFQSDFALVLVVGLPFFIGGVWLFNRGRRIWKGQM
jgi:hypothetical protein